MSQKHLSVINVRVTPNAKNDEITGTYGDGVKIRLRAPAVEGKANKALIAFLAKQFGLARNAIRITSGDKARNKRVEILGLSESEIREILGL